MKSLPRSEQLLATHIFDIIDDSPLDRVGTCVYPMVVVWGQPRRLCARPLSSPEVVRVLPSVT